MQELPPVGSSEDRHLFQMILGYYDAPAFIRRIKRVEEAGRVIKEHLHRKREDELAMVRLRIGQFRALAGDWQAVRPLLATEESLDLLRDLHDALEPKLRLPLEPTNSLRTLRGALQELVEAMEAFNRRWRKYIDGFDLTIVNALRDGYNRHYLVEKECALGNGAVARLGFKRLDPVTTADLLRDAPLLEMPQLADR
jgi:hypothetical protein